MKASSVADNQLMTLSETASFLGVSQATVVNWIKHEHIKPVRKIPPFVFNADEINNLKSSITDGATVRLGKRANKIGSERTFIPSEYLGGQKYTVDIESIVATVQKDKIDLNVALFLLSLNFLIQEGLLQRTSNKRSISLDDFLSENEYINVEIKDWFKQISDSKILNKYGYLLEAKIPRYKDVLGLIYQSLLREGKKSEQGAYYTPLSIVENVAQDYALKNPKFLDPCCGTGQFLLVLADFVGHPRNLFGVDIDEIAVRIARINVLVRFKEYNFNPNIYCKNTLFDFDSYDLFQKQKSDFYDFDLIATNPPWGVHFSKEEKALLQKFYPDISSMESFSYFLKKSVLLLKENGVLSFILPESMMTVRKHKDIREFILKNSSIKKIIHLDRVFKNVFTPVVRLDLIKSKEKNNVIQIDKEEGLHEVQQERLIKNRDFVFDVNTTGMDEAILDKAYKGPYVTLEHKAEWALGIVTGNNDKYISNEDREGFEEIYKGKDVKKFGFEKASSYIHFIPEKFQQVAPEYKYRVKEKLVYRFISKNLIFAYDDQKRLTLNSANILIPRLDDYPIKVILALFNSSLYQFIFQKKFSSIKVLRNHIEQLPLPLWDQSCLDKICKMVHAIEENGENFSKLDRFIMKKFGLKKSEIDHIEKSKQEL